MAASENSLSPSSGLWSSFHSSLTQAARGPGTPQRQQVLPHEPVERGDVGCTSLVEFKNQFTELDLLME